MAGESINWGGVDFSGPNWAGGGADPAQYAYAGGRLPLGEYGISEIGGWRVPTYFAQPPGSVTPQVPLGPAAAATLAQLFPNIEGAMHLYGQEGQAISGAPRANVGMWESGAQPRLIEYETTPGVAAQGESRGVAPVMGRTAAVAPIAPSAQLWQQMENTGLVPMFNRYLQDIGIDPSAFQSQMKNYWPTRSGARSAASWKTPAPR